MTTEKQPSQRGFHKGNEYWKMAVNPGRPLAYETPELLWEKCQEYFQWVDDNPLYEMKVFQSKGKIIKAEIPKMRAMTEKALYLFLNIDRKTWYSYRKREGYDRVTEVVESCIFTQKFEGAAADLLNVNIIARELHLAENVANTHASPDGGPVEYNHYLIQGVDADYDDDEESAEDQSP